MKFEITQKNEDGSIAGEYKLNRVEAQFVLNVGLNYLAAAGAMPMFTGKDEDDDSPAANAPSTETVQ